MLETTALTAPPKIDNRDLDAIYELTGHHLEHLWQVIEHPFKFYGDDGYRAGGLITHVEFMPSLYLRFWAGAHCHYEWLWNQEKLAWSKCRKHSHEAWGADGIFELMFIE